MRLKTLTVGIMLAFVGLAGSATHAESGSLGVQANSSTSAALDSQAGNAPLGVSSDIEIGAKADVDAEHRGEVGADGTLESKTKARHNTAAEASGRSQSILEGVSSTLETARETGEQWRDEAVETSGRTTGNLGAAATAEGSASTSGEVR